MRLYQKPGLVHKDEKGITLIELVVVLGVAGIITSAITMTFFQVFINNAHSTAHMTAVKQVENAIHWLNRDVQGAQSVNIAPSGFPLTLTWVEWNNKKQEVTYRLGDMGGGAKQLERQHVTYDASGNVIGNQTTLVARYIDPGSTMTNCQYSGGVFTYTITATVTGLRSASETRKGEIKPRPSP